MPSVDELLESCGASGDGANFFELGRSLEKGGDLELAASAYDRAYGLAPHDDGLISARQAVLDQLAVDEHGLRFRYIPAGSFLMGSDAGDADEQPIHRVRLSGYWLSETPVSWATYCSLMGWEAPPAGVPADAGEDKSGKYSSIHFGNRMRLQYCETQTLGARGWHSHMPRQTLVSNGKPVQSEKVFGQPLRANPELPWTYEHKPMVAVSWARAQALGRELSTSTFEYRLPTEAEWEKGARGGLIGSRYAWGDAPPDPEHCDFGRFSKFAVAPMKQFLPNGYGLYAMNGGVWEWTLDRYDAEFYASSPTVDPRGPDEGQQRVLRGGSWADCADAVTVSFRMSLDSGKEDWGRTGPTIGFRLCRVRAAGA